MSTRLVTGAELLACPRPHLPFGKRLRLRTVQLGSTVAKSVSAALVGTKIGATVLVEAAECAALASAAQSSSAGAVVLRLPLSNAAKMEEFSAAVAQYAAANEAAVMRIAQMSAAEQVMTIGMRANVLAAVATAAVQEGVAVAFFVTGAMSPAELVDHSVTVALSATTTIAGGTAGAAIGTLVFPGAGTAIGSLLGSYVGAFAPSLYAARVDAARIAEEEATALARPLKTVKAMGGDWLEVVDCSVESMLGFDPRAASSDFVTLGASTAGLAATTTVFQLVDPVAIRETMSQPPVDAAGDEGEASDVVRADEALLIWEVVDEDEDGGDGSGHGEHGIQQYMTQKRLADGAHAEKRSVSDEYDFA